MMIQGHPVDLKQTYTICVNNYRAVGGQYDMYHTGCKRYSLKAHNYLLIFIK